MTKLTQVSTIACSSSAMLEQHGLTRSCRDVTNLVEFGLNLMSGHKSSRTINLAQDDLVAIRHW